MPDSGYRPARDFGRKFNCNSDRNSNRNSNSNFDSNSDRNFDCDSNSNADSDCDRYANRHSNSDFDSNADRDADRIADALDRLGALAIAPTGAPLFLLPQRAVYLPGDRALLVADVHFGKAETFQRFGVPVASRASDASLDRLARLHDALNPAIVCVLGDLFHSAAGVDRALLDRWVAWRSAIAARVVLLAGNHDRPLLGRLTGVGLELERGPLRLGPFHLSHEPAPQPDAANLCGHVHPCLRLRDRRDDLRLPCFYWRGTTRSLLLPSFGEFTGGFELPLEPDAIAYLLADGAIVPLAGSGRDRRSSD